MTSAWQGGDTMATGFNLQAWMGDLNEIIGNRPLNMVVMPQTHDSASYGIGRDTGPILAQGGELSEGFKQFTQFMPHMLFNWGVTQRLPIEEQLKAGARSFDIRVGWREQAVVLSGLLPPIVRQQAVDGLGREQPEGMQEALGVKTFYFKNFYAHHNVYSVKIEEFITPIIDFVHKNPTEVVILSFGGFINMDNNRHEQLKNLIKGGFYDDIAYDASPTSTLNQIRAKRRRVIVTYEHDDQHSPSPYLSPKSFFCDGTWPNKQNYRDLVLFIEERTPKRLSNPPTSCDNKIWNTSFTITPDNDMILKFGSFLGQDDLFKVDQTINKRELISYLTKDKINPNLVSVDFLDTDLAWQIVNLNVSLQA
jgi:hypothetical protein